MTQAQLGERLGVTSKTISGWETGTYLPPAEMLMVMSEIYGITVNEILSARRLSGEEYRCAAESNLRSVISDTFSLADRVKYFRRK